MGLYIRSARSLLLAYSFVLAASLGSPSASLLPRYLVQLFRRLKGPRYADMLFVTRKSRHGCLRQAGRRDVFPLSRGNCERRDAAYRTLIFRQRFPPFPSTSGVSFTCLLPALPGRAGRFQPPRGRSSRRRHDARGLDEILLNRRYTAVLRKGTWKYLREHALIKWKGSSACTEIKSTL